MKWGGGWLRAAQIWMKTHVGRATFYLLPLGDALKGAYRHPERSRGIFLAAAEKQFLWKLQCQEHCYYIIS